METFRPLRRQDRQLSGDDALSLLERQNIGVLSVCGDEGYPYGVPVNYAYADGRVYIHSTGGESHKLDAIRRCPRVSLTVIAKSALETAAFTTRYASVILFGTARLLTDGQEKQEAAIKLMGRLVPGMTEEALASCGLLSSMVMIEIAPEHITGKAN